MRKKHTSTEPRIEYECDTYSSCCNWQYSDRLSDIEEEANGCTHLIEVQRVRHGYWIQKMKAVTSNGEYIPATYECSDCSCETHETSIYCSACGALMDGNIQFTQK